MWGIDGLKMVIANLHFIFPLGTKLSVPGYTWCSQHCHSLCLLFVPNVLYISKNPGDWVVWDSRYFLMGVCHHKCLNPFRAREQRVVEEGSMEWLEAATS